LNVYILYHLRKKLIQKEYLPLDTNDQDIEHNNINESLIRVAYFYIIFGFVTAKAYIISIVID
jgi:hypothetical protein